MMPPVITGQTLSNFFPPLKCEVKRAREEEKMKGGLGWMRGQRELARLVMGTIFLGVLLVAMASVCVQ